MLIFAWNMVIWSFILPDLPYYTNIGKTYANIFIKYTYMGIISNRICWYYTNIGIQFANIFMKYTNMGIISNRICLYHTNIDIQYANIFIKYTNMDITSTRNYIYYTNMANNMPIFSWNLPIWALALTEFA